MLSADPGQRHFGSQNRLHEFSGHNWEAKILSANSAVVSSEPKYTGRRQKGHIRRNKILPTR